MHLIQYYIELFTGLTSGQSIIILNVVYIILWTIGFMAIVALLAKDRRAAYLAAAFTGPFWLLYYQAYILPSVLSLFLLPALLAVHIRRSYEAGSSAVSFVLIEILIALLLVYLHPSTTLFFIAMLLSLELFTKFKGISKPKINRKTISYLGIALISTVVFFNLGFILFIIHSTIVIYNKMAGGRNR